jgi:hypothetical protein
LSRETKELHGVEARRRIAARDEQAAQLLFLQEPCHHFPEWIFSPQGSRAEPSLVGQKAFAVPSLVIVKLVEDDQRCAPLLVAEPGELLLDFGKCGFCLAVGKRDRRIGRESAAIMARFRVWDGPRSH